jgi:ribosome-associated protein
MRPTDTETNPDTERPSRSARKREALDVLTLAKQLSELPPARVAKLELPDDVRDELAAVQRVPSHIAHKRELAYLAKLMRTHDEAVFAVARAALANARTASAREAAALHQLEALRDGLLGEAGDAALAAFIAGHPGADHQRLRALVRQARREQASGKPPRAQRELFRLLRDMENANG